MVRKADEGGRAQANKDLGTGGEVKRKDLIDHIKALGYTEVKGGGKGGHAEWHHTAEDHSVLIPSGTTLKRGTVGGILDKVYGLDGEGQ